MSRAAFRLLSLIALLLAVGVMPASAQINPFRGSTTGLPQGDLAILGSTAAQLYENTSLADGSSSGWSSPKTGNSGKVTLLRTFHRNSLLCREVEYTIHKRGVAGARDYKVNWCRTPSGAWKLG